MEDQQERLDFTSKKLDANMADREEFCEACTDLMGGDPQKGFELLEDFWNEHLDELERERQELERQLRSKIVTP